jgi:hypothetical protein
MQKYTAILLSVLLMDEITVPEEKQTDLPIFIGIRFVHFANVMFVTASA